MTSNCCETFKSLLDSIFGGSREVKEETANEAQIPILSDFDDAVVNNQHVEFPPPNYQSILDQASSDFLASKLKGKSDQLSNTTLTLEQVELLRKKLQQAIVSSSVASSLQPTLDIAESQSNKGQASKKKRSKNRKSPDNQLLQNGVNQEDTLDTSGKVWDIDSTTLQQTIRSIDPIAHFSSSDVR